LPGAAQKHHEKSLTSNSSSLKLSFAQNNSAGALPTRAALQPFLPWLVAALEERLDAEERGEKHPRGASLKRLALVAKNGLEAVA
jgi:hypothetical protein